MRRSAILSNLKPVSVCVCVVVVVGEKRVSETERSLGVFEELRSNVQGEELPTIVVSMRCGLACPAQDVQWSTGQGVVTIHGG